MTEVPEHLLARSRARRAALGLGGGEDAAAPVPAAGGDASPAPEGAAAAAAPAAKALAPVPAGAPPAPPAPPPPYVQAALDRKRIPIWAMPVLVFLPLWGLIYVQTLEPPPATEITVLQEGEEIYAANCAGCHGGAGGGGAGRQLSDGEVIATFPNLLDQVQFVQVGTAGFQGEPFGAADRPGGQRIGGDFGVMPAFGASLTDEQVVAVVRYEREVLSGEEYEASQLGPLEEILGMSGTPLLTFDDAGTLLDADGSPVFSASGFVLPGNEELLADVTEVPVAVYPDKAGA